MAEKAPKLISPYGGTLVDLMVPAHELEEVKRYASGLPSLQISERSACDLELLATGAFSPLDRFMGEADYRRSLEEMRLGNGFLFPVPVTLPAEPAPELRPGADVALRNAKNELLAVMTVDETFEWDRDELAHTVLGTSDLRHPLVSEMHRWGRLNLSGAIRVLRLPSRYDFQDLRLTPAQTRERLEALGNPDVVAFQARSALHRAHEELAKRAAREVGGTLFLHPAVGMAREGDVDHYARVRTYRALAHRYFDPDRMLLALLPLATRMAGPREALWHALIRRNYGANYVVVGPDYASPGVDSAGRAFYAPYDARELVERYAGELGVKTSPFREFVYLPEEERYEEREAAAGARPVACISGSEVRDEYLNSGRPLPEWFTRPEVAEILSEAHPPRHRQGVCVWFTGLSGAGKSTTADILTVLLLEHGRQVTVLDGDVVRTHLSKGLGFGKEDRDINIRRIGYVAAEIVRHGGVVICAAVSPYRAARNDVRNMMRTGHFVEVFVDTPLQVCEQRDVKGMYAKARRGEIKDFTGIDDPYEPPLHPEVTLDTVTQGPEENARRVLGYLKSQGFVRAAERPAAASHLVARASSAPFARLEGD